MAAYDPGARDDAQRALLQTQQTAKTVYATAAAYSVNLFEVIQSFDLIAAITAGTDTTDLSTYITAALAGASKRVILGPGKFNSSNSVVLNRTGHTLDGVNKQLTTLNIVSDTKPAVFLGNGVVGYRVSNMAITRQLSNGGTIGPGAHGVQFEGSTDRSEVMDLEIEGHFNGAVLGTCDEGQFRNINIRKSAGNAILQSCSLNYGQSQWRIDNVLCALSAGAGYLVKSPTGSPTGTNAGMITGIVTDLRTFANSDRGVHVIGTPQIPIFDLDMRGLFLGSDGLGGARFDTYGGNHTLHAFIERAGLDPTGPTLSTAATGQGAGYEQTANNLDVALSGRSIVNALDGVFHNGGILTTTGLVSVNNGQSLTAGRRNGILTQGGRLVVTGGRITNDSGNTSQLFGVAASHANVNLGPFDAPSNTTQAIYLAVPTGATVFGISPPGAATNSP